MAACKDESVAQAIRSKSSAVDIMVFFIIICFPKKGCIALIRNPCALLVLSEPMGLNGFSVVFGLYITILTLCINL
jgi:hypothetical protein